MDGLRIGRSTWLFGLSMAVMAALVLRPLRAPSFSSTDDAAVQMAELGAYVADGRPVRVVQVDPEVYPKVSQIADIDSSPTGFGRVACGPMAAAVAMGGDDWPALLDAIVAAAGDDYGPRTGIQPTPYAAALRRVFGWWRIEAYDGATLGTLYHVLRSGRVVIVDVKVDDARGVPAGDGATYAHFARVLGMDVDAGEIYLENTLEGPPVWTVTFETFLAAWRRPETTATIPFDPGALEDVDRWAVAIGNWVRA